MYGFTHVSLGGGRMEEEEEEERKENGMHFKMKEGARRRRRRRGEEEEQEEEEEDGIHLKREPTHWRAVGKAQPQMGSWLYFLQGVFCGFDTLGRTKDTKGFPQGTPKAWPSAGDTCGAGEAGAAGGLFASEFGDLAPKKIQPRMGSWLYFLHGVFLWI
jgi:hypothetical protein